MIMRMIAIIGRRWPGTRLPAVAIIGNMRAMPAMKKIGNVGGEFKKTHMG